MQFSPCLKCIIPTWFLSAIYWGTGYLSEAGLIAVRFVSNKDVWSILKDDKKRKLTETLPANF